MRCKRCGNPLDPMDTRCPVCGKTLTPPRRKAPAQKPAETTVKLPQLDKFIHAYGQDAGRSRMLQLVTIAAAAVLVALLVMVYMGLGDLQTAVNDLKLSSDTNFQALRNQTSAPQAPTDPQTDPTEEPTAQVDQPQTNVPLEQQALEASLMLYRNEGNLYAAPELDLGGYEDRVVTWVSTAAQGGENRAEVSWILDSTNDRLNLTVRDSAAEAEASAQVSLEWTLQGTTFANLAGTAVCIWEYRVAGGSWESVPNEYAAAVPEEDRCSLTLTADQLAGLLGDYNQMELRCHVNLTHPAGGAVKIVAEGITLSAAAPVTDSDQPA